MQRLKCKQCESTLLFHDIKDGVVEIMCKHSKCKALNRVECKGGICKITEKKYLKEVAQ